MEYLDTPIGWPLDKNLIRRGLVNNTFGMVRKNLDGTPRPHQGWDFVAKNGTNFYSIADGTVAYICDRGALGLMLVISIGKTGKYAAYCHLEEIDVSLGEKVLLGTRLGKTGSSGNAVGMKELDQHLHFEIRNAPITGTGLTDRISPLQVFGMCPLQEIIQR